MWHDPMDELIDELEARVPADVVDEAWLSCPPLEEFQRWLEIEQNGTEAEIRLLQQEPRYKAYIERGSKKSQGAKPE